MNILIVGASSGLGKEIFDQRIKKGDDIYAISRYSKDEVYEYQIKYSKKITSMKIHRLLSWVHFAGMASIPFLGYNIGKSNDYDKAVRLHQNVAYMTLFTMSLSALLTFLPY